jgi:hypothetical protein
VNGRLEWLARISHKRDAGFLGDAEKDLERPSLYGMTALSRRGYGRWETAFPMLEGSQGSFAFTSHFSRRVEAEFSAGQVCRDGGALLSRAADRKINMLGRLAGCFSDSRPALLVKHQLPAALAQRIYGLALGCEDLNDQEQLRSDPLLRAANKDAAGGAVNEVTLPPSKRYRGCRNGRESHLRAWGGQ